MAGVANPRIVQENVAQFLEIFVSIKLQKSSLTIYWYEKKIQGFMEPDLG